MRTLFDVIRRAKPGDLLADALALTGLSLFVAALLVLLAIFTGHF